VFLTASQQQPAHPALLLRKERRTGKHTRYAHATTREINETTQRGACEGPCAAFHFCILRFDFMDQTFLSEKNTRFYDAFYSSGNSNPCASACSSMSV
jgi:hypothetical protein